ncbi:hypothetical protein SCHPADRAFT_829057 [Schizopora paradoxa]|uniref:CDP-alcohol phosphatidyltransferase n=1 Tax=Schizopora paradoxa TaxID=27342 RepID=A0A0H2RTB7_9AGAM|nr:hypothetical protein SCHPADRAFT_829057 [Schizopora paradoxa]
MANRIRISCSNWRPQRIATSTPQSSTILRPFLLAPSLTRHASSQRQVSRDDPTPESRIIKENIYTIPNALTLSRIAACPFLGWSILNGDFANATALLLYAGMTDWVDGYLARRFQMKSVLGTILDPAADKILMTTLTICLAAKGLLPHPLAFVIIGRDVLLGASAFYIRYKTLPDPKTFKRYWNFSIPSAEVRPTQISKVNTALQLLLMGVTTISPLIATDIHPAMSLLQLVVGGTTVASGISYVFSSKAVRVIGRTTE